MPKFRLVRIEIKKRENKLGDRAMITVHGERGGGKIWARLSEPDVSGGRIQVRTENMIANPQRQGLGGELLGEMHEILQEVANRSGQAVVHNPAIGKRESMARFFEKQGYPPWGMVFTPQEGARRREMPEHHEGIIRFLLGGG